MSAETIRTPPLPPSPTTLDKTEAAATPKPAQTVYKGYKYVLTSSLHGSQAHHADQYQGTLVSLFYNKK